MRRSAMPWLALLLVAELAFCLASRLVPPPGDPASGSAGASAAGRFFSATRSGLGANAIEKADLYLHRGVGHVRQEAFSGTWFQNMGARISVKGALHREGKETVEVIPWLWFGTVMDPDNIDYALMAAYWLKIADRDDLAMGVVKKAIERHPRDARLYLERARLLLRAGKSAEAAGSLDIGETCLAGYQGRDADAVSRSIYTYRGLIHESNGDTAAAAACFSRLKDQTPEFAARLDDLRLNRQPSVSAATILAQLVTVKHECNHDSRHDDDGQTSDSDAEHAPDAR